MRSPICLGLLLLVALAGCSPNAAEKTPGKTAITQAAALPANLCVIDVRSDVEWQEEHLASAVHLPLDQFRGKIGTVVPDKKTPVGVYCASGMRSGRAAQILRELGYERVENLGGLDEAKQKLGNAPVTP